MVFVMSGCFIMTCLLMTFLCYVMMSRNLFKSCLLMSCNDMSYDVILMTSHDGMMSCHAISDVMLSLWCHVL